jgi:methylthioxylose transferase
VKSSGFSEPAKGLFRTTGAGLDLASTPSLSAGFDGDLPGGPPSDQSVPRDVEPGKEVLRQANPNRRWLCAVFSVCAIAIGWAVVWGRRFERREPRIKLGAAPFVGKWDARISLSVIPVVVLAFGAIWLLPRALRVLSDWLALLVTSIVAVGFAFALAATDGLAAVLAPVVDPTEYFANLELLPKASDLVLLHSNYDFLVDRTVHMKGHPPGFVLILKALAAIGLNAPWVVGALSFLGIAMIVSAVGVTVRARADGVAMRLVLPFLALTPFAVWLGTSADAFFSGVAVWGVATMTLAIRSPDLKSRMWLGLSSGLLLSGSLFLTYGAATLMVLVAVMVLTGSKKRFAATTQVALAGSLSAVLVTGVFYHFGFWWFDGLRLTNKFYWVGSAYFRTWTYFLLGNVAVLLIAIGPAVVAGIASLRDPRLWPLVGGAILCLMVAEASQYSKGEVERIWLLFMPWLVPAVAGLSRYHLAPTDQQRGELAIPKRWLAIQAVLAIVLQVTLRSKW